MSSSCHPSRKLPFFLKRHLKTSPLKLMVTGDRLFALRCRSTAIRSVVTSPKITTSSGTGFLKNLKGNYEKKFKIYIFDWIFRLIIRYSIMDKVIIPADYTTDTENNNYCITSFHFSCALKLITL